MRTIKVYSPSELKKKHPEGFERAHEWYKSHDAEIPWQGEIMDSLKAVFDASGINLRDWSIDAYGYSYVKFSMNDEVRDLSGNRALAWLENNLINDLRIKHTPMFFKAVEWHKNERAHLAQYGKYYRAGMIKPCPFTGVCFDEDYIESLFKSINEGDSLGEAYDNLANVAAKLFQNEIEAQQSEEYFLDQGHLEFTKEGHRI